MHETNLLKSEDLVRILNNAKHIGEQYEITTNELVNIMKNQLQSAMNKEKNDRLL